MITDTLTSTVSSARQANWIYLQDELARMRLLLTRLALWQRAGDPAPDSASFYRDNPQARELSLQLETISARCRAATEQNLLPIAQLAREFGLSEFETDVLLLALAVELDTSFDSLFAQCQGERSHSLPTVALALRLFCESADDWVAARLSFSESSALLRFRFIHLDTGASLLTAAFHLDERIANYLLGINALPAALAARIRLIGVPPSDRQIRGDLAARLRTMIQRALAQQPAQRLFVNLLGARGAGKRTLAAMVCAELGASVLAANANELMGDNTLALFLREAILMNAVPYLDCTELTNDAHVTLNRALDDGTRLVFLGTFARAAWIEPQPQTLVMPFEVPALGVEERRRLWQAHLGDIPDIDVAALAARFPFAPGDIMQVAASTRAFALSSESTVRAADVWRAARTHPQHHLGELARRIEPKYEWDDIVLPAAARQTLAEIGQQVAQQARVYDEWGFGKKLSRGRGISALFAGPSGTGKTMAAEILAGALGLDLYRIDLSSVVSKYIGETEKNLARVFYEAERSGVILFFDEADALFGKRSEVKDAHDRYANIEINYLLQRMEDYQGLAILATNMRQALDEAFLRRLRFLIEFPFPDAVLRAQIWRKAFPSEMPRENIDIDFLARQFKIAGGNIRNIVLNAAFLAAAENRTVRMPDLIHATKREFDKIGKACLETDFGQYFGLVR